MGWSTKNIPDQTGRYAIVTGANSGIGFEAAKALAAKGAHVTLACRNLDKANAAKAKIEKAVKGAKVETKQLDLADLASVEAFAEAYHQSPGKLDLLVNNAGVMVPPYGKTKDGFELQFGANHLGHFALTAKLMDLLDQSDNARIVNVSSQAHRAGDIRFDDLNWEKDYKPWSAYGQSKLANLLFTYELDRRLKSAGKTIAVTAAHPGWSATNLQRTTLPVRIGNIFFGQAPKNGALPTLRAATDPDAPSGTYWGPRGLMEMNGAPVKVDSNKKSKDPELARRLWDVSEQMTGQRFPL